MQNLSVKDEFGVLENNKKAKGLKVVGYEIGPVHMYYFSSFYINKNFSGQHGNPLQDFEEMNVLWQKSGQLEATTNIYSEIQKRTVYSHWCWPNKVTSKV